MSRGKRTASRDDEATFQQMVSELKPLARQLKDREEKQRVILWLRKLQEPFGDSPVKKENRLMYTRLLLHMLKRGVLEGPFHQSPEQGELKTLPSYMSIYFDDSHEGRRVDKFSLDDDFNLDFDTGSQQEGSKLLTNARKSSFHVHTIRTISPILSETNDQDSLSDTDNQLPLESLNGDASETELDIDLDIDLDMELQKLTDEQRQITRSRNKAASRRAANEMNATSGLREKDIRTREEHEDDVSRLLMQRTRPLSLSQSRQPRSGLHSPRSPPLINTSLSHSHGDAALQAFREERNRIRLQQKEIDLKLKMADNQFQEEKLQLQAQHDRQLKEMLDHKNTEIEIVKAESRQKVQDAELTMEALERKVNQLEKESQHVREHKDKQMNELKTKVQQKIQDLTSDLDARV
jgi:centrosomal protein CEP112